MAVICLTDQQRRTDFFHETILINLTYWLDWLTEAKETEHFPSDYERNAIIRAISYGLDLGQPAWPSTYQLITTFSPYIERAGHWEIWGKVAGQAHTIAGKATDTSAVANLSILLARLSSWQNRFKESTTYYRQAISSARQIENRFTEARACSNLGYLYTEYGCWYRAEVLCCHALDLFKQIDNHHGQAHTENHLGILYIWQSQWRKAEHHLERACALWRAMADNNGLMYGLTNLGLLFVKTSQPEKALSYLKEALHWAKSTGETYRLGNIYLNIGLAHNLQRNFKEAVIATRQAEAIFQAHANLSGLMHAQENVGIIYQTQQDWEQAITYLNRALAGWRELNKKQDEIQTIVHLAKCELSRGDQHQAAVWMKAGQQLFNQYPQSHRYYQLPDQLEKLNRTLRENIS
ncbi:MAG: tetratricopeptide repeat protein [Anaerolineae bacterium]|nr:tetratricopeptide repeat protein [Anaerolineae bacterium]